MTKLHKKLLVIFCAIVCTLCLCLGVTACKDKGEHTHTFDGFWLFDGEDGHYRLATCHPEVKSETEPHVDEDGDFNCDVCGYVMHVHVDEDGDNFCDDCENEIHKHTYEDEWTFNEIKHWHKATCDHFIERDGYADHRFADGACECGVKESEVKVYDLYKNSPEYELYFVQWLDWLESEGITVEYTESGDGVYHFADGHSEVHFLGERTVKVKAQADGEPLADVWFMVTLYANKEYFQKNGTIALGIAKTDQSGIAEIAFNPVGGYSASDIEYRIRIAEKKDIAVLQGVTEEQASLPFPNRCQVAGGNSGFEYKPYTVSENANSEEVAATVEFKYSKGWNSYNTIELPYKRYYEDLINGKNVREDGTTYKLTASGKDLFDYFIFEPAKYSFKDSNSNEDSVKIENNAKIAASGIYKISFTYTGNAHVTLYFWDELGVNMSASHQTKADGTPSDDYITSVSGGAAGDGKYTGGNFVNVTVTTANGLRQFQFGIISDEAVEITIIVERVGDYVVATNGALKLGDNNNITLLGNGEVNDFRLANLPAGYYYLTVNTSDATARQSGMFSAYVDPKETAPLWDGNQIRGIITVPEGAEVLYIVDYHTADTLKVSINIAVYTPPVVKLDEQITVPISGIKDIKREILLDESVPSGIYRMELTLSGGQMLSGASYYVRVIIGDNSYPIALPISTNYSELVSAYFPINQGDTLSIYILVKGSDSPYRSSVVNGKLKLVSFPFIEQGVTVSTELSREEGTSKEYVFIATRAGTYNLSIIQTNEPEFYSDYLGYTTLTVLRITNSLTSEIIKAGGIDGETDINECNKSCSTTFTLQEGETAVLKFTNVHNKNHLNIDFIIEYVED